ncbi:reverse transcriptase domain-containing protein [Tanacetum coccineum]
MFKYGETKNEVVRLMMFPLSLTGEAKTWLDKLNKRTIKSWDERRTTFISRFFPPTLFDRLLGEIRALSQHEHETLTDAWLRMNEMLRNCHSHNLSKGNIIKIFYYGLNETTQEALNAAAGGIFLYKTPNQAYQLPEDKVLLKLDWDKNQKPKPSLKKTIAFIDEGSSNSDTDKIMTRMDAMILKMDAQYKEMKSRNKCNRCGAKFDRLANKQSARPSGSLPSNTQPNPRGNLPKPYQPHDDEDEEPTPQPKSQPPKPVKETPTPKPYKPMILYPQCLRKEKMKAQYGKFLDMIRVVRINVPLVNVLVGMPNYVKFLKETKKILILVGIKRLLDDLRVTAAKVCVTAAKHKLVPYYYWLKVNAAGMKVTTAERLQLLEEFILTEKRLKTYKRKYKDFLKIKIT